MSGHQDSVTAAKAVSCNAAFVPPPSAWFENDSSESSSDESSTIEPTSSLSLSIDDKAHQSASESQTKSSSLQTNATASTRVLINPTQFSPPEAVGNTHPSPSWKEISSQVLPAAARELLSSSWRRVYHTARLSYAKGMWQRKYSDMGNNAGGIHLSSTSNLPFSESQLPPISSLNWIERQLVMEWRTYLPTSDGLEVNHDEEEEDFERARALVPKPFPRPKWQKADICHQCHKPFSPTRLRHHCRMCGYSFCQPHSSSTHSLPHLGYDPGVHERVCDGCKRHLQEQNLAERVAWRLARCRDYSEGNLTPYFEVGLDSASEVAARLTKAALAMARSIPLGAQASMAVETVDVLRKYGLHGIYGIMLRQEFLAAADLLRKALGINKTSWPLSVHELSAAIFYALAQHRAMRGLYPEREEIIHTLRSSAHQEDSPSPQASAAASCTATGTAPSNERMTVPAVIDNLAASALSFHNNPVLDQTDTYNPTISTIKQLHDSFDPPVHDPRLVQGKASKRKDPANFVPVCDPLPDSGLSALLFYAPIALNFAYVTKEVDMQLLAAQQGWRLLYAYLEQDKKADKLTDRPASAVFVHKELKIICLAIRGTATINDVVTDIRQVPVPFPEQDEVDDDADAKKEEDWTDVFSAQGLALSGMSTAAVNIFREHIDSLLYFAKQGYRIRITGHSLGGGVATMVGVLTLRHFQNQEDLAKEMQLKDEESALLRVYSYGTPSCVDARIADSVEPFVTTVVLHDDVFPRLTPTSCRGLLKHLLHIRETWVKTHIEEDLRAVGERARTAWAPRFRQSFTLKSSSKSIKTYCRKQLQKGKKKLSSATRKITGQNSKKDSVEDVEDNVYADAESQTSDPSDWGEKFFIPTTDSLVHSLETSFDEQDGDTEVSEVEETEASPPLLLEFLGGVGDEAEGLVIDGDEFFDTENNLIESDDDESVDTTRFHDAVAKGHFEPIKSSDSWTVEGGAGQEADAMQGGANNELDENTVVLDETPLPRMFIPGKVVHIYSHRGVYKAAYVPRTFRELRRLSLAGNMLSNHSTKSYFEGLLEVQTARLAPETPPRWTAFDEDDTCCCCASRFTWASTSDSEAQEARDKHNCRSCGGLVCNPCATKRIPIAAIGLTVPVRVCDRCYNDMGEHSQASSSMTSSFLALDDEEQHSRDGTISTTATPGKADVDAGGDPRPERQRQRRSFVVDELASRIRSSALASYS